MVQKKAVAREKKAIRNQESTPKKRALKAVEMPAAPLEDAPKAKNIGEALKTIRRSKEETLKTIAAKLRISEPYLKAIEAMDCNNLPEQVFESSATAKKLSIPQHVETAILPTKRILWISTLAVLVFLGLARYFWSTQHADSSLEQELSNLLRPSL